MIKNKEEKEKTIEEKLVQPKGPWDNIVQPWDNT